MKNKKSLIILIFAVLLIALIPTTVAFCKKLVENIELTPDNDFIYITSGERIPLDDNMLVYYDDYKILFNSDKLKEEDFEKHSYVIVEVVNNCDMVALTPTDHNINNYTVDVQFRYKQGCDKCSSIYSYYLIEVEKTIDVADVRVEYQSVGKVKCNNVEYKKNASRFN